MKRFDRKIDIFEERFRPIKIERRKLYPRNLRLSENFVNALKQEYRRLSEEGHDPKRLVRMLEKALPFHLRD